MSRKTKPGDGSEFRQMDMPPSETQSNTAPPQRTILFVALSPEDSSHMREGLRDTADKWRLEFVSNVRQALTALEGTTVDAAVVDLQAPGIDAPGLFKTLMEASPTTLRLGLVSPPDISARALVM